jgi:flagellar biosynthetic protein FliR
MEILNLIPVIYAKFVAFILIFMRIATMLWTFNIFRRELITGRIIFSLASVLSFYIVALNNNVMNMDVFSLKMLISAFFQVFIGFLAGMILNIVFEVFLAIGQIISSQIGLGMASLYDPRFGSITTLSHFYMMVTTIIFLLLNGHLFIIQTIMSSFDVLPVDKTMLPQSLMSAVLSYSGTIFSGSIMLSITIIITILLTNTALAVMTKFAPQFNIFSVGINMTLIIGLITIYITFNMFIKEGNSILVESLNYLQTSLHKLK